MNRLTMIIDTRMHGTDDQYVINDFRETWQEFRQWSSGLAMLCELPWRTEDARASTSSIVIFDFARKVLQVSAVKFRFWIE